MSNSSWSLNFTPVTNDDFTGCNSIQDYIDFEPGFTSVNKIYLNMSDEEKKETDEKMWMVNMDDMNEKSQKERQIISKIRSKSQYSKLEIININEKIIDDRFRQDTGQMGYSDEKLDNISGWSRTFARRIRDISHESNGSDINDMMSIFTCLLDELDMDDQL
uniref:Uncharacterized protein n=1 Tax=Strongyloides papillosus TaxID=174720 RepID=A0A0N5CII4_STREA